MTRPTKAALEAARKMIRHTDGFLRAMVENNFDVAVEVQEELAAALDAFAAERIDAREMRIVTQCQAEMDEAGLDIIKQRTFMNVLESALDAIRSRSGGDR